MGRSHAKNSHSSPIFSHFEKSKLPYGSKKQRLNAESFRRFDSCQLCNSTVRDPCACPEGHLYCRECILESLLSQKKLIEAHKVEVARRAIEDEEALIRARAEARERVLKEFERTQSGLGARLTTSEAQSSESSASLSLNGLKESETKDLKRKFGFDLDLDAVGRLASEAEDAAMAKIEKEQAEARKAKLPAFWLPSLAPEAGVAPLKEVKLETMCQADTHPHPLSIKKLITVHFTPLPASASAATTTSSGASAPKDKPTSICPSCSKELTNASTSVIIKTCGHVVCKSCCEKIVKPGKQCVACDGRAKEKDLVELKRDGTGYAAAGGAEAVKVGTAFQ